MDAKKSNSRRLFTKLKNVTLVLLSAFFIYNVYSEVTTTMELQDSLAQAKILASEIEEEREILTEERERLQNPDYVKRYARGKLLVSEDGEQVFALEDSED